MAKSKNFLIRRTPQPTVVWQGQAGNSVQRSKGTIDTVSSRGTGEAIYKMISVLGTIGEGYVKFGKTFQYITDEPTGATVKLYLIEVTLKKDVALSTVEGMLIKGIEGIAKVRGGNMLLDSMYIYPNRKEACELPTTLEQDKNLLLKEFSQYHRDIIFNAKSTNGYFVLVPYFDI